MPAKKTTASQSAQRQYQAAVRAYVAAGGDESVQRVITAVYGLTRKLDKWYGRQLADLEATLARNPQASVRPLSDEQELAERIAEHHAEERKYDRQRMSDWTARRVA